MTYLRVFFLASLTSVLISFPLTLPAQFRVHVGLGYDAAAGGQTFGEQTTFQSADSYTSEIAHTSLGQGLVVNAGATYLFDSHDNDFDSDDPSEGLAPRHPFGSVGVVIGVKVDL